MAVIPISNVGAKRHDRFGKPRRQLDEEPCAKWFDRELELMQLVNALGLDESSRDALFDDVRALLTHYLFSKQAEAAAPYTAQTITLMHRLAGLANELQTGFEDLPVFIRTELLLERLNAENIVDRNSILPWSLNAELNDFRICVLAILKRLEPPKVGTPGKAVLIQCVERLIEACERYTGECVHFQRTRNSIDDPHLPGRSGKFLCAAVALYIPGLTERDIANTVRNIRDRAKRHQPRIVQSQGNSRS